MHKMIYSCSKSEIRMISETAINYYRPETADIQVIVVVLMHLINSGGKNILTTYKLFMVKQQTAYLSDERMFIIY